VIVRYVVANDSHKPAGPLRIGGSLSKNGVKITPGAKPFVLAQQITLQPNQIWKAEYNVTDASKTSKDEFNGAVRGYWWPCN
jgi:hypothetical protein